MATISGKFPVNNSFRFASFSEHLPLELSHTPKAASTPQTFALAFRFDLQPLRPAPPSQSSLPFRPSAPSSPSGLPLRSPARSQASAFSSCSCLPLRSQPRCLAPPSHFVFLPDLTLRPPALVFRAPVPNSGLLIRSPVPASHPRLPLWSLITVLSSFLSLLLSFQFQPPA